MFTSSGKLNSFWRHPLFHFAVLGVLIFVWDAVKNEGPSQTSLNITVTSPEVTRMVSLWEKTWGRPPTPEELQGLVKEHIREEIYYREAKALGLDQNDIVIRRRLRQKMEFLSSDVVETQAVEDSILLEYYNKNMREYQAPATLSVQQIYYSDAQKEQAITDLQKLKNEANINGLGEPISLPSKLENADSSQISKVFGSVFYSQIEKLEPNIWHGPIRSGFGVHLVRTSSFSPAKPLAFSDVKTKVEADWRAQAIMDKRDESYQELRDTYNVTIQMPE